MKDIMYRSKWRRTALLALAFPLSLSSSPLLAVQRADNICKMQLVQSIVSAQKINPTTIEILFSDNQRMMLDFYGEGIFRMFQDNAGGIIRDPEAKPEAKILVDTPRIPLSKLEVNTDGNLVSITTDKIKVELDKTSSLFKIINLQTRTTVLEAM